MRTPRPVPQMSQFRPQISPAMSNPIQSPMMMGQPPQPPQQTAEDMIIEDVQNLAMEIYCRVIAHHICGKSDSSDPEVFQCYARHAQAAARAYFEALGVQF